MKLTLADSLDEEINNQNISLLEYGFSNCIQAVYCNFGHPVITVNKTIQNTYARNALKAHELGHHYTCSGNLFFLAPSLQKKCEHLASRWACYRVMSPEKLVLAYQAGVRCTQELSEYLEINFEAISAALYTYRHIYGTSLRQGEYIITFEPFNIFPEVH